MRTARLVVAAAARRAGLDEEAVDDVRLAVEAAGAPVGLLDPATIPDDIRPTSIEPVGNYGIKPTFSDGHDSGLFTWEYLYFLGSEQDQLWADYERRLKEANIERDAPMPEKAGAGCSSHAH